jgi:hypothetical protein
MNPFNYILIAQGDYFYDRTEETVGDPFFKRFVLQTAGK